MEKGVDYGVNFIPETPDHFRFLVEKGKKGGDEMDPRPKCLI